MVKRGIRFTKIGVHDKDRGIAFMSSQKSSSRLEHSKLFQVKAVMMISIKEKKSHLKSGISKDRSLLKGTKSRDTKHIIWNWN